jgi:hypothetical protein
MQFALELAQASTGTPGRKRRESISAVRQF